MRRVLVSLVLGASLAVIGAGSAFAGNFLPAQACNAGTLSAAVISGNQVIPAKMGIPLRCMTMPEWHP